MAKTGLMLATGLTKAVDSFFKARELRDLKAQKTALDNVKYMIQLQNLENARLTGRGRQQAISQNQQLFGPELSKRQKEAKAAGSEAKIAANQAYFSDLQKGLVEAGSAEGAPIYDRLVGQSIITGRSPTAAMLENLPQTSQSNLAAQDLLQSGKDLQLSEEKLLTEKKNRELIEARASNENYKLQANQETSLPIGQPIFDQYFPLATATIAGEPDQINVYKKSIRDSLAQGNTAEAQSAFKLATLSGLSPTERGKIREMEIADQAAEKIQSELQQYYQLGGDTNVFAAFKQELTEGAAGQIFDDMAKEQQNPALQKLTLSIKAEFFKFRQAVSGAAFSDQETADYFSLWPQAGKSQAVNQGRINSMVERNGLKVANAYMGAIGAPDLATTEQLIGPIYRYDVSQVSTAPLTEKDKAELEASWNKTPAPAMSAQDKKDLQMGQALRKLQEEAEKRNQ